MGKSYVVAVPRGPQLRRFKLEPKRSWHINLTPADILFNVSEEFDRDRDKAIVSDDALSSQADEAAVSNGVSLEESSSPKDCGAFGGRSNEKIGSSASADPATRSRKASKRYSDVIKKISNTA
ncbi:MAG: hypothetical protein Q9175_004744 [Cornicularia normoerica]